MRVYQRISVLMLCLTFILGGCGRGLENAANSTMDVQANTYEQETVRDMRAFFDNKYASPIYTVSSFLPKSWASGRDQLCVSLRVNGEKELVTILREKDGDGFAYLDNYFSMTIRSEVEEKLISCFPLQPKRSLVYAGLRVGDYPNTLDKDAGLEDLIREMPGIGKANMNVAVCAEEFTQEEFQRFSQELEKNWEKVGLVSWLHVFCVDKSAFDSLAQKDLLSLPEGSVGYKYTAEVEATVNVDRDFLGELQNGESLITMVKRGENI